MGDELPISRTNPLLGGVWGSGAGLRLTLNVADRRERTKKARLHQQRARAPSCLAHRIVGQDISIYLLSLLLKHLARSEFFLNLFQVFDERVVLFVFPVPSLPDDEVFHG